MYSWFTNFKLKGVVSYLTGCDVFDGINKKTCLKCKTCRHLQRFDQPFFRTMQIKPYYDRVKCGPIKYQSIYFIWLKTVEYDKKKRGIVDDKCH